MDQLFFVGLWGFWSSGTKRLLHRCGPIQRDTNPCPGPATSCALPAPSGECLKFRRHQMCRASGMPMHSKDADASKGRL